MDSFRITTPSTARVPVLLSVPHCGTVFPDEIKGEYDPELIAAPDDTDWYVDRLYGFAHSLGITMISAVFSRWVIDLNRLPQGTPLYSDGRIITHLCPVTTFLGQPIYVDERTVVLPEEVERRTKAYFEPYHRKLGELLTELKAKFGKVLLWDCHSIRQHVPTIRNDRFPDLILGSAGGASASPLLIETALESLRKGECTVSHNHPFQGGYITRHYGKPSEGSHALQLEMTKINYMDDSETEYHSTRAEKMAERLNNTLNGLAQALSFL